MDTKRVLIVDALNMYFRAYIVDPSLSTNGQPIGGVMGFMKILQKQIRETKPDRIVIAWDGPGGSRDASGRCTSFALLHAGAHLKFDVPGFCRQTDAGRFPSEGPDSFRISDTVRVCLKRPRGASDMCNFFAQSSTIYL